MGGPKIAAPPQPTPEELARQAQAEQAAKDAEARAAAEKLQAEQNASADQTAIRMGLRGRRSLLSTAGEAGFTTGLGGV